MSSTMGQPGIVLPCKTSPVTTLPSGKISFISCARGYPPDGGDFEFVPPPEAPIFRPTEEEFALGPLAYVAKIRPLAEPYGICKIIPPASFKPNFAVNINDFVFTPRVQRLNELDATTRIKLNFLEQLHKFWELQGSALKIPFVDKKGVDLQLLHKIVQEEGGFESCTRERKWSKVANRLAYNMVRQNKGPVASLLRQHYERILFPYDVFLSGATIGPEEDLAAKVAATSGSHHNLVSSGDENSCDSKGHDLEPIMEESSDGSRGSVRKAEDDGDSDERQTKQLRQSPRTMGRRMGSCPSRMSGSMASVTIAPRTVSKELKKLQVHGAGPKMPGVPLPSPPSCLAVKVLSSNSKKVASSASAESVDSSNNGGGVDGKDKEGKHLCVQCGDGVNPLISPNLLPTTMTPYSLVSCFDCGNCYHLHCLIPPLTDIPKGKWHCARCIACKVQSQPQPFTHEFGFAQSHRVYTLAEFQDMADNFKNDYFRMKPRSVPLNVVEREFWRIMSSMEDTVTVEYGADLHTSDYGSGFATSAIKNLMKEDTHYLNHPWNLNNLPILDGSVFKHINTNISGMIVPWMYVGMCFSTFCWHNEDHWSYSINYLHWGEPKSWYGVPGEDADTFERAMKRIAPELFESQPDLLHQLVTICNPNTLMAEGVPIYKANQMAGEFVVTFPRAYHAGYNQGMNFAEAVNFAPPDWLPIGRVCVKHYSMLNRYPVFSHDELICKMASQTESLDPEIALATYHDMIKMVESEMEGRRDALNWGITQAERETYELLPDDERQCHFCKTTCFLSAIVCPCSLTKLVCINHRDHLCSSCPPSDHVLKYRYTLDELPIMLDRLKMRAEEGLASSPTKKFVKEEEEETNDSGHVTPANPEDDSTEEEDEED